MSNRTRQNTKGADRKMEMTSDIPDRGRHQKSRPSFRPKTFYGGVPSWPRVSCKSLGSYLHGQGHSVGWNPNKYLLKFWKFCIRMWCRSSCALFWASVVWQFWMAVLKVKVTVRILILGEYLSGWYLLNHLTFLNETWYDGASSWCRVLSKKVFKVKVWSQILKKKFFFHNSQTSEPFAIWQFWYCCQGHSEHSDLQRIFFWMIFSELLHLFNEIW